jgi:hypothetical protein
MSKQEKCKHPACNCMAPEGQAYCREMCRDARNVTELACQCNHSACRGGALSA